MQLSENDGKRFLKEWGIAVPRGFLLTSIDGISDAFGQFDGKAVFKIQVPAGKRGKAGGVRLIHDIEDGKGFFRKWIGERHGGFIVGSILAEEPLTIEKEFYMSVALNAREGNYIS